LIKRTMGELYASVPKDDLDLLRQNDPQIYIYINTETIEHESIRCFVDSV